MILFYMSLVLRKPAFCICENKDAVTAQLISAFVFATWIVQSLFYLNPECQASNHLLWLYSLVCVRPRRKPRRPVSSQRGSYISEIEKSKNFKVITTHQDNTSVLFTPLHSTTGIHRGLQFSYFCSKTLRRF